MPYIKQEERDKFYYHLTNLFYHIHSEAELTYVIYTLAVKYFQRAIKRDWLFRSGILRCLYSAYHEFERHYVDPYENKKKEENGDVS